VILYSVQCCYAVHWTDNEKYRQNAVNVSACYLYCTVVVCLCAADAIMVAYTGSQSSVVSLQPLLKSHTNDISLRFRTPKRTGLLFVASSRGMTDYIRAFLNDGFLKLETKVGGVLPVINEKTARAIFSQLISMTEREIDSISSYDTVCAIC